MAQSFNSDVNTTNTGSQHSPPSQRSKRKRTTSMYERKRAVAACQVCRVRKTKCDNVRPTCGFCQRNSAQCVYAGPADDFSSYDPASLAILDRINHVVTLLEAQPAHLAACLSADTSRIAECSSTPSLPLLDTVQARLNVSPTSTGSHAGDGRPAGEDDHAGAFGIPELPAAYMNTESVMRWPIFNGIVPETLSLVEESDQDHVAVRSFSGDTRQNRKSTFAGALQEDSLVPLSRRFLAYVHVKNPILDVTEFKYLVKEAAENGPQWDGPSCLVLVACALGCLASPFQLEPTLPHRTPESFQSCDSMTVDRDAAEVFYLAAKKRLGLLRPSLTYVQCLFLCGVFEMYLLRPQQAWFYFQQASSQLQNHLWRKTHFRPTTEGLNSSPDELALERRLEQRLYWSCMKTECELRCELPLPPSGIIGLKFPDLFPSPPTELSSPSAQHESLETLDDTIEPEEEKSWFYYLAEISFRRMMDRMTATLSISGERGWINNIQEHIKQCGEFVEDINLWCSHIPPKINFNSTDSNPELAYYIRGRALNGRELIHRPFLYYVVHQPADDPYIPRVMPLAKHCLSLCVDLLQRSYHHHRHHGTWFVARTCLTRALLLLAAVRSQKIEVPDSAREMIDLAMLTVQKWYDEAPDLKRGAVMLESIINNTF